MMLQEKIEHSIKLLKTYQDVALSRCPKGYIVGYSGGKDSDASDCTLPFKNGEEFIDWWTSSLSIDDWKHLHDIKEKQIKMF